MRIYCRLGEPCRVCGNTDLNKFAIETENKLRCIQCQTTANQTLTFNKCCPVIDFISAIFTSPSAVASAAASNADLSLQHDDRQKDLQRNELIKSAWPNVSSPVATVARSQQSTKEPDGGDEIYWYSPPPTAAEPDDSVWLSPLAKIADEGDNTVNNDLLPQLRNASVIGEVSASLRIQFTMPTCARMHDHSTIYYNTPTRANDHVHDDVILCDYIIQVNAWSANYM